MRGTDDVLWTAGIISCFPQTVLQREARKALASRREGRGPGDVPERLGASPCSRMVSVGLAF